MEDSCSKTPDSAPKSAAWRPRAEARRSRWTRCCGAPQRGDGKPGPSWATGPPRECLRWEANNRMHRSSLCGLGSHLALACCCGPRHLKQPLECSVDGKKHLLIYPDDDWCFWISWINNYPLVNKHRPWKSPIFIEETSLPTPMTARVYVNLPEGNS